MVRVIQGIQPRPASLLLRDRVGVVNEGGGGGGSGGNNDGVGGGVGGTYGANDAEERSTNS
jgi:hypothetical protein